MLLRVAALSLLASLAFANEPPAFPGSETFEQRSISESRFDLALGGMEKKDGVWRAEYSQRVGVNGQRITYNLGREASVSEAFSFYENYFKNQVNRQLFSCEALDCGSSAQWANSYFHVRELYGVDTSQRLAVWLLDSEPQQVVNLYVVQRGNKNVYAHIDVLALDKPLQTATAKVKLLRDVFAIDDIKIDELRDVAQSIRASQAEGRQVWMVGHFYAGKDQQDNLDQGRALAENLSKRLRLLGVQDVVVDSVGMLAPLNEAATQRVSVISVEP